MKRTICVGFLLICMVLTGRGQNMPEIRCNIPWSKVMNNEFEATWTNVEQCASYNAFLLEGYTRTISRTMNNLRNTSIEISRLRRNTVYGVIVVCVDANGNAGTMQGSVPCRTRTFGQMETTTPSILDAVEPPLGSCGSGMFTCEDDSCIEAQNWCDRRKNCPGGTDEEDCPNSCPELTIDNGNLTCSLFFSPFSACFFACATGFMLDGPVYTVCIQGNWSRAIPTCRTVILDASGFRNFPDFSTATLTVEVTQIVVDFVILSLLDQDGNEIPVPRRPQRSIDDEGDTRLIDIQLEGLPRRGILRGIIAPIDEQGVRGRPTEFTVE